MTSTSCFSKEKVRIPTGYAAEMVALRPLHAVNFESHYAGFFDPGFGLRLEATFKGSHAVLEVRSHEVPFLIQDGQMVGRLYL